MKISSLVSLGLFAGLLMFGCAKEDAEPEEPEVPTTTGPAAPSSSFSWTEANSTSTITADSSVCYVQITTIYAYKNGTVNTVELNLSDIGPGQYNVSSTTGNEIKYVRNGATFLGKGGVINITSSSNGRINGNFSTGFATSSPGGVSGNFSNVKMR